MRKNIILLAASGAFAALMAMGMIALRHTNWRLSSARQFSPGSVLRVNTIRRLSFNNDGSRLLLTLGDNRSCRIAETQLDGRTSTLILSTNQPIGMPIYSPDGQSILFVKYDPQTARGQIWISDATGQSSRKLMDNLFCDDCPSFSADGKSIVFIRSKKSRTGGLSDTIWEKFDVWLVKTDGKQERQLTHKGFAGIDPPYLSNDGSVVLFAAGLPGASSRHYIYTTVVAADGSPSVPSPLFIGHASNSDILYDSYPRFMPGGQSIVFVSSRNSRKSTYDYEVWTAELNGKNPRQLTKEQSYITFPVPSPDGAAVAYLSDPSRSGVAQCQLLSIKSGVVNIISPIGK